MPNEIRFLGDSATLVLKNLFLSGLRLPEQMTFENPVASISRESSSTTKICEIIRKNVS
jgi:hypothetical protein